MSGARRSPGPAVTSTARALTQRLYGPRSSPRSSSTTPQIVSNVIGSAAPLGFEHANEVAGAGDLGAQAVARRQEY